MIEYLLFILEVLFVAGLLSIASISLYAGRVGSQPPANWNAEDWKIRKSKAMNGTILQLLAISVVVASIARLLAK